MNKNDDPFAPWNDPMNEDHPFAPHNNPMEKDNPFKPWNTPMGKKEDLSKEEMEWYDRH